MLVLSFESLVYFQYLKQFLSCRKPLGHAGMWSAGTHLWLLSRGIQLLLKKDFHSSADKQV